MNLSSHDPGRLRAAYAQVPTGVSALCAQIDGEPVGMVASSVTAVSLEPALVSVCIMQTSRTWRRLAAAPRVGVSVLAAGQGEVCRRLAARSGDRFRGIEPVVTPGRALLVPGAALWLDCEVEALLPGGDHTIVLLRVHALDVDPDAEPLVHHAGTFRDLVPARAYGDVRVAPSRTGSAAPGVPA